MIRLISFVTFIFACSDGGDASLPPKIISVTTDTNRVLEDQTLTVTAVARPFSDDDPAKLSRLVVRTKDGAVYELMAKRGPDTYEATIDWAKFNRVADIISDSRTQARTLVVEVAAENGATATASFDIELSCRGTDEALCQPGQCFSLTTDANCGSCGNSDLGAEDITCVSGELLCDNRDRLACFGDCTHPLNEKTCGSCDNNCEDKADHLEQLANDFIGSDEIFCGTRTLCNIRFSEKARLSCLSYCQQVGMRCDDGTAYYSHGSIRDTPCNDRPMQTTSKGDFVRQECICLDNLI